MANKFFADPSGGNFYQGGFFETVTVAADQPYNKALLACVATCITAWWVQPVYSANQYTTSVEEGPIPVVGTTRIQQFATIADRWVYTPEAKQPRYKQVSSVDQPRPIGTDGRIDIVNLWQLDWPSQRAGRQISSVDDPPVLGTNDPSTITRQWELDWGSQKAKPFIDGSSVDDPGPSSRGWVNGVVASWGEIYSAQTARGKYLEPPAVVDDPPPRQAFKQSIVDTWLVPEFSASQFTTSVEDGAAPPAAVDTILRPTFQWGVYQTWEPRPITGIYLGTSFESVDNPPSFSTQFKQQVVREWIVTWGSQKAHNYTTAYVPDNPPTYSTVLKQSQASTAWQLDWGSQKAHNYTPEYVPDNPTPFSRGWFTSVRPQWEVTWDSQRNGPYVTEDGPAVAVPPAYPGVSFTPGPAGGKYKGKKRTVIIGDRSYEVESLRDVEFLLKRVVRQEAEPVLEKAKKVVVDRVATKLAVEAPVALPDAPEIDWEPIYRQLAAQDKAYAEILRTVLRKQDEDDIETLLMMF